MSQTITFEVPQPGDAYIGADSRRRVCLEPRVDNQDGSFECAFLEYRKGGDAQSGTAPNVTTLVVSAASPLPSDWAADGTVTEWACNSIP